MSGGAGAGVLRSSGPAGTPVPVPRVLSPGRRPRDAPGAGGGHGGGSACLPPSLAQDLPGAPAPRHTRPRGGGGRCPRGQAGVAFRGGEGSPAPRPPLAAWLNLGLPGRACHTEPHAVARPRAADGPAERCRAGPHLPPAPQGASPHSCASTPSRPWPCPASCSSPTEVGGRAPGSPPPPSCTNPVRKRAGRGGPSPAAGSGVGGCWELWQTCRPRGAQQAGHRSPAVGRAHRRRGL